MSLYILKYADEIGDHHWSLAECPSISSAMAVADSMNRDEEQSTAAYLFSFEMFNHLNLEIREMGL